MTTKTKMIVLSIIILTLPIATWLVGALGNTPTINSRPPLNTTTIPPLHHYPQPMSSEEIVAPVVDKPHTPVTEPIVSLQGPEPQKRIPGTSLSQRALDDLGLSEPLEYEGIFYTTATPNDPIYPQWYSTIISAPDAWDTSTGSSSTIVAVIDTGYALDHQDLASAWYVNTGEQGMTQNGDNCWTGIAEDKQTNGCDDDNNGYADDWRGWDFSGNDNNVQTATNSSAGNSHGTRSAGLVGARGNNTLGVASINWNTQIMPLQALFDEGFGYSTDITAAIYYAVDNGADVINMSLGGPSPDSFTLAAVQYALRNNVIVVTSSGNCGDQQIADPCIGYTSPGGMGYPARYSETIAVGATTSSDARASFSSWGDELTLVAPGSGTIQTPTWTSSNATSAYSSTSYGTSFSSPIVAGAIAMLKADMPSLSSDEAVAILANSSDKVSGMGGNVWAEQYGWGRLNVDAMLDELETYKTQLLKGAGQIAEQSTTTKPHISTSRAHTVASAVTNSNTARTYCLTTPLTECTFQLKRGSSSYTIGTQLTNAQGITIFEWTRGSMPAGGYVATVTANSITSDVEKLIIQ